jgi:hypothetical protein
MMRLVLDTNVLLSALMSRASPSAEILSLWRDRKVTVLTAAEQIDEIAGVTPTSSSDGPQTASIVVVDPKKNGFGPIPATE